MSNTPQQQPSESKPPVIVTVRPRRKITRGLEAMEIEKVYGSGNYGVVFKARDRTSKRVVALKRIKTDRETQGFPITALREIKILNQLRHENIVALREMITCNVAEDDPKAKFYRTKGIFPGDVFMVFDFAEYDLAGLLKSPAFQLSHDLARYYMHQLLAGVQYMHEHGVLHRDIKCANILVTADNVIKIADWGLARLIPTHAHNMTVPVVTLWYRSPELILERRDYGKEVDIWSVGCMFMELFTRTTLFTGGTESVQLENIFTLLGTPEGALLDRYKALRDQSKNMNKITLLDKTLPSRVRTSHAKYMSEAGFDLFLRLLDLDPDRRITAQDALNHRYFHVPGPSNFPRLTIEPITEHMVNEDRRRRKEGIKEEDVPKPLPKREIVHDNVGHSRVDFARVIESNPEFAAFTVKKKAKPSQASSAPTQIPQEPAQSNNQPSNDQAWKRSRQG